jgi:hypothetical protein
MIRGVQTMNVIHDATPILHLDDIETLLPILTGALGAEITYRWPSDSARPAFVVVRVGKGQLGLARRGEILRLVPGLGAALVVRAGSTAPFEWAVAVDDVEATCARLVELGARMLDPPAVRPWGETSAWLLLPASLLVQVYRPASRAAKETT